MARSIVDILLDIFSNKFPKFYFQNGQTIGVSNLPQPKAQVPQYNQYNAYKLLPPANEVWGKVIFSQASVCPQGKGGWRREGVVMMSLPVIDSTCPWTAPTSPDSTSPAPVRWKSGRYASHWNTFLFYGISRLILFWDLVTIEQKLNGREIKHHVKSDKRKRRKGKQRSFLILHLTANWSNPVLQNVTLVDRCLTYHVEHAPIKTSTQAGIHIREKYFKYDVVTIHRLSTNSAQVSCSQRYRIRKMSFTLQVIFFF